jgi:hypothetical protein
MAIAPISKSLGTWSKASEVHHKLVNAYGELERAGNTEVEERVLRRAAELLYIVRSNISHGEKTPYGPDLAKKEWDESVCAVAIPIQHPARPSCRSAEHKAGHVRHTRSGKAKSSDLSRHPRYLGTLSAARLCSYCGGTPTVFLKSDGTKG